VGPTCGYNKAHSENRTLAIKKQAMSNGEKQ